jgi:hypothetical protein
MSGGDDIQAGRWNTAETTTVLAGGRPTDFGSSGTDFVGTAVLRVVSETGAIHPKGRLDAIVGVGFSGGTGLTGFGAGGGNGVVGLGSAGDGTFLAASGIVATGGLSTSGTPTTDDRTPHGAGLVATAGSSVQQTPLNIASDTGNVGVFGQGGDQVDATKNAGGSNFIIGPGFAGAGVVGRGGVQTTNNQVPNGPLTTVVGGGSAGIVGIAGGTKTPQSVELVNVGVFGTSGSGVGASGTSDSGTGVFGKSDSGAGVSATSDSGTGVFGKSDSGVGLVGASNKGAGVAGSSVDDRAAVLTTFKLAQLSLTPLVKVPANLGDAPQVRGRLGDLLATKVLHVEAEGNVDIAELWFCNSVDQSGVTNWVRLG